VRLLAQHHVGQVVQALIAWRQNVNEDIKKKHSVNNVVNVQGVCKRVSSRGYARQVQASEFFLQLFMRRAADVAWWP